MLRIILIPLFLIFLPLSALAEQKPVLNIYTYDSFAAEWGAGPKIKQEFAKICDCEINFVTSPSSISALRKIQLEGEQTKADILLGIDSSIVGQAQNSGLFTKHGLDLSEINVPTNWSSKYFIPFDYGYFAFIYNREKLSKPPSSFAQLIDSDIKIIVQDGRSSTVGFGLILWIKSIYKEKAKQFWQKLSPKIVTMTKGWSESYNLFLKGEADMVLSYTTSPAYHLIVEQDNRFRAAQFSEGHYMQIEVAGIVKTSKNKQLARQFLRFLISKEAQQFIPTGNWMYPVAKIKLPEEFTKLYKPNKPLLLDEDLILQNGQIWIAEMLDGFK